MAFEDTTGGLGGLGGFVSGLGDKLGSSDMLTALALIDAGRARVNPPPLAQTLGPIMALQAKKQDQERERTALAAALTQLGLPPDQARLMASSDSAAKIALQAQQLKQQRGAYDNLLGTIGKNAPGWGGDASSAPEKRSDATDLPDAATPFHNLVANAEGTAQGRGYDETLGYGKFTGGPVNLTGMKVADVLGLQQQMLQHPENNFNSSAAGAYQVVGKTLRGLVDQGIVSPDDPYDAATQNKIASFLAQQRGPNPAALRAEWAGLKNVPDAQIVQAWNASFGNRGAGQPGHLTEPPPMNLSGADSTTQVASADPRFVPPSYPGGVLPRRVQTANDEQQTQALERGLNMMPGGGDDGKSPSQVLVEQQRARDAGAAGQVAQNRSANTASDAPQPGIAARPAMPAGSPPPSPDSVSGERTQKALALKNFDYWTKAMLAASNPVLGDAGKGVMEMAKANIAIASKYLEPTEIQRNLDALNLPPAEKQAILRNALPDTRPASIREAEYVTAKPEMKDTVVEMKRADKPETTIKNFANPVVKGLGDQFIADRQDARDAVRGVGAIHQARSLIDEGMFTGPAAEVQRNIARVGSSVFGTSDKLANTDAYATAIGQSVLETVKGLGSGQSISNADRVFAEKMAGGQIKLNEASLRKILDIREQAARAKIQAYNEQVAPMVQNADDELKPFAGSLTVKEPKPYAAPEKPQAAPQIQEGATATNPRTGAKIQFRNGRWEQIGGQL